MDKLSILKELLLRLQNESPEFFKKWQKYSIYFMLLAAIPLVLEWAEVITLPGKLDLLLYGIISFFAGTGGMATLPVKTMDAPPVVGGGGRPTDPPKP